MSLWLTPGWRCKNVKCTFIEDSVGSTSDVHYLSAWAKGCSCWCSCWVLRDVPIYDRTKTTNPRSHTSCSHVYENLDERQLAMQHDTLNPTFSQKVSLHACIKCHLKQLIVKKKPAWIIYFPCIKKTKQKKTTTAFYQKPSFTLNFYRYIGGTAFIQCILLSDLCLSLIRLDNKEIHSLQQLKI